VYPLERLLQLFSSFLGVYRVDQGIIDLVAIPAGMLMDDFFVKTKGIHLSLDIGTDGPGGIGSNIPSVANDPIQIDARMAIGNPGFEFRLAIGDAWMALLGKVF